MIIVSLGIFFDHGYSGIFLIMDTAILLIEFSEHKDPLKAIFRVVKHHGTPLCILYERFKKHSVKKKEIHETFPCFQKSVLKTSFWKIGLTLRHLLEAEPPCIVCNSYANGCFRDHPAVASCLFWFCSAPLSPRKWLAIATLFDEKGEGPDTNVFGEDGFLVSFYLNRPPFHRFVQQEEEKNKTLQYQTNYEELFSRSIPLKNCIPSGLFFYTLKEAESLFPTNNGVDEYNYVIVVARLKGEKKVRWKDGRIGFQSRSVEVVSLIHDPWYFEPIPRHAERIVTFSSF